jgi:oxygen-independent coproporphyrinogen-3 oxidase
LSAEPLAGNYFVATYPPFSCWSEAGAAAFRRRLDSAAAADADVELGLYVHIPFCVERCPYCYYLSYDDRSREVERYLDALGRELALYAPLPVLAGRRAGFVYFGGGTPSVLSTPRVRALLARLRAEVDWAPGAEVTFECAPKSVGAAKLDELLRGGVTRLSMGVQALDDETLRRNGRVHLVEDVERAWRAIAAAGFPDTNLDLIVGLVGETDESFLAGVERAIELGPSSLTIYQLELPLNTPLYRTWRDGALETPLPDWDTKRSRLARAFERLEAARYALRSAYTAVRGGSRFRYQDEQYRGADLLALGASAFAHIGGVQHQNLGALDRYLEALERGAFPLWRGHALDREELAVRELVLGLKLGRIDREHFRHKFDVDIVDAQRAVLEPLAQAGWLRVSAHAIELTRPGLLRADFLVRELFLPRHRNVRYS